MLMTSLILLTAAVADPTATQPARDPDAIVCVNRVQTGSRTAIERTCHTRAEWVALRRAERAAREPERPNLYYPGRG